MSEPDGPREPLPVDAVLRAVVEGVEAEVGAEFFRSLVRHLAASLGVQYAFVTEFSEDRTRFRTVVLWGRGAYLPNLEVPLGGTPCEAVLSGRMAHHPARLQALFPEDRALVDWRAESYAGVPLVDATGTVRGHLAVIDDEPMPDGGRSLAVMRIFAARASAELERARAETALRESRARLAGLIDSALDAIVAFDPSGVIELFNPAAEKVFRCPATEAIGGPLDRFLTASFRRLIERATRGGQQTESVWASHGVRARDRTGREFPIEATISHVEVEGRAFHTLILRDVETHLRAEEERRRLERQNVYLQEEIRSVYNFEEIIGQSPALRAVLEQLGLVAGTDSSVLILGETGTGKELVARAVHSNSPRRDRPLIKVNCAALPSGLIESELFGHEKGAFTGATERRIGRFELAHGGTIFLDEIGELPADVQAKLLRVLQEQEFERIGGSATIKVDVRVLAATNRDLARAVEEGSFRRDLYYRLNVFPVTVPPLRDRPDDIPLLVHYFVTRYAAKIGRPITRVPEAAMARFLAYRWPGNVRELENVIERAVILSPGPDLEVAAESLPPAPVRATPAPEPKAAAAQSAAGAQDGSLRQFERAHILSVLRQTNWRIDGPRGAARILSLHPNTLRSRIQRLGIRRGADETS